jgi:hypothetical protein
VIGDKVVSWGGISVTVERDGREVVLCEHPDCPGHPIADIEIIKDGNVYQVGAVTYARKMQDDEGRYIYTATT